MGYYMKGIRVASPMHLEMQKPPRLESIIAYPGWRWRIETSGMLVHEKIPNPILRFIDWVWRFRFGLREWG